MRVLQTKEVVENTTLSFLNNRSFRRGLTHELTRRPQLHCRLLLLDREIVKGRT
jgi:hypothetical protein